MRRAVALVLCWAATAGARELARFDNGGSLELSGFYKNQVGAVLFQPGLVEGSRALADLTGSPALPAGGVTDSNILRAATAYKFKDWFEFDAAFQLSALLASDPALLGTTVITGTATAPGKGPERRLVPVEGTIAQGPHARLDYNLDRFAVRFALPFGDLTIGRQVLSWGTGHFWNPTDVLSPFPPTAIDREVRRGFDAVRLAVALGETTQLDLLYLPRLTPVEMGGVARFQTNVLGWDWSLSFGKYVFDLVAGADLVGDLGPVAVHAEGAYTVQLLGLGTASVTVGEHFFRGVLGADFKPHQKVVLTVEYSFNGYGSTDPTKYATILTSERAVRGEVFGAGKHVGAVAANFRASDLLSTQLSVLCNLTDPSALAFASVEYSILQWILLRAGVYVPIGKGPDASVFTSLTPQDAETGSAAYQTAVTTAGLRSEYGSSSYGAFVQLGLYLP